MKHAWSRPAMLAAVLVMGTAVSAHAEIAGEKLYKQQCAACHAVKPDAPMGMGPTLHGILGKEAGKVAGFPYSEEFKAGLAGKSWTPELLDKWLEQPQKVAKGTYMMYQQPDPEVRKAIIEYLKTIN
jgi:cytochrome c